jgi:hypothetical protein
VAAVFHDAVSWGSKLAAFARPNLVRCGVLTRLWPSQDRAICRVCVSVKSVRVKQQPPSAAVSITAAVQSSPNGQRRLLGTAGKQRHSTPASTTPLGAAAGTTFLAGVAGALARSDAPHPRPGSDAASIRRYFRGNPGPVRFGVGAQLASAITLSRFTVSVINARRPVRPRR